MGWCVSSSSSFPTHFPSLASRCPIAYALAETHAQRRTIMISIIIRVTIAPIAALKMSKFHTDVSPHETEKKRKIKFYCFFFLVGTISACTGGRVFSVGTSRTGILTLDGISLKCSYSSIVSDSFTSHTNFPSHNIGTRKA